MLALISFAFAVDTVVYPGGDPADALRRVAAASGAAASELTAISVGDLMAGRPPTMVAGGQIEVCSGAPSSPTAVRQSITLAEGGIKYMEYGSARAALDAAIKDLGCLQTPVDATQASRAFYLRGIVSAASGDQAGSRNDFRRARLFAPTMVWDDNFAPTARATFDAITNEVRSAPLVSLSVLPPPATGTFLLDGQPVNLVNGAVGLAPGEHFVQIAGARLITLTLEVEGATPPTLVIPSAITPGVLEWAGDADQRASLSAVLVSALGSEGTVYVANPSAVWRVRLGGSAWDLVGEGSATGPDPTRPPERSAVRPPVSSTVEPLPIATTTVSKKPGVAGPVLISVGGAAGLAGGIVGALGYQRHRADYDVVARANGDSDPTNDIDPQDPSDPAVASFRQSGAQEAAGFIVAGLGGVLLATGIVVTVAF